MGLRDTFRTSLITGLALIAPLVITFVALQVIQRWLSGFLDLVIEAGGLTAYVGNVAIAAQVIALLIVIVVIALLGYLTQQRFAAWFFDLIDRAIGLVPLVSVIYSSVRQVSNALLHRQSRYESVALVEYPRDDLYMLGFITSESPPAVTSNIGEGAVNVYVPNSPNPTGGKLLMVPDSQITELDMSVSRGIRLLVTTGIAEEEEELRELRKETA